MPHFVVCESHPNEWAPQGENPRSIKTDKNVINVHYLKCVADIGTSDSFSLWDDTFGFFVLLYSSSLHQGISNSNQFDKQQNVTQKTHTHNQDFT